MDARWPAAELGQPLPAERYGHTAVIDAARRCGAIGWKLNGAGGDGGSLTLFFDAVSHSQRQFADELRGVSADAKIVTTYLSRQGLRVWESPPAP